MEIVRGQNGIPLLLEKEEDLISLFETDRSSSWNRTMNDLEQGLQLKVAQTEMILEDYRAREVRELESRRGLCHVISCSLEDLYEFERCLLKSIRFAEDSLATSFELKLADTNFVIDIASIDVKPVLQEDLVLQHMIPGLCDDMEKAAQEWNLTSQPTCDVEMHCNLLEIASLKEKMSSKLHEIENTRRQILAKSKMNDIKILKQREMIEKQEKIVYRQSLKLNDKRKQQKDIENNLKSSILKFVNRLNECKNNCPEFEEPSSIYKSHPRLEDIPKLESKIQDSQQTLAKHCSQANLIGLSRLQTQLSITKSYMALSRPRHTRMVSLHTPQVRPKELWDNFGDAEELLMKEISVIKTRFQEDYENLQKRQQELYAQWVRTFENDNLLEVVRMHTNNVYKLEENLMKQKEQVDRERVKIAKKKEIVDKKEQSFLLKQRYFGDSVADMIHLALELLDTYSNSK